MLLPLFSAAGEQLPEGALGRLGAKRYPHSDSVTWIGFGRNNQRIFSSYGKGFCVWDTSTGKRVWKPAPGLLPGPWRKAQLSRDGKTIFLQADGVMGVMSLDDPETVHWLAKEDGTALAVDDAGKLAVSATMTEVIVWDLLARSIVRRVTIADEDQGRSGALAISPDGSYFAARTGRNSFGVWETASGKLLFEGAGEPVSVEFSQDGAMLGCAVSIMQTPRNLRAACKLIEIPSGNERWDIGARGSTGAFSPDCKTWALVGAEGIEFFDTRTGKVRDAIPLASGHGTNTVAYSRDGTLLAAAGRSTTIRVWDLESRLEQDPPCGHDGIVSAMAIAPNGEMIVTGGPDRTLRVWSRSSQAQIRVIELGEKSREVDQIEFSPDGTKFAADLFIGGKEVVRVFDAGTGAQLYDIEGDGICFNAAGDRIFTGSRTGLVREYDASTGGLVREIGSAGKTIGIQVLLPDGKTLIWRDEERNLRCRDLNTGLDSLISGPRDSRATIAKDGTWCASGSIAWELPSGRHIFGDNSGNSHVGAISDDSACLAWSGKGLIRIWHRQLMKELRTFHPGESEVLGLKFSPNGKILASTARDGTVLLWDFNPVLDQLKELQARPPASEATLQVFRTLVDKLPFITYVCVLDNREPRETYSPQVRESRRLMKEFLSAELPERDVIRLVDDPDPKIRTLALLRLFHQRKKEFIPHIASRSQDNSPTIPAHIEDWGRRIGEETITIQPMTIIELVRVMLKDRVRPGEYDLF